MIEIEKYSCTDGNQARSRERHYYDLLNAKLNKVKPLTTEEERRQMHKEYKQKEQYKDYNKLYGKKYRDEHVDEMKEYNKEYRKENKDKIHERKTEKITCNCGSVISRNYMSEHLKTFTHISHTQPLFQQCTDESNA
jgi:hypothetical protein